VSKRRLTVEWDDPKTGAVRAAGLSGIDYVRAMISGEVPDPPMARLLGYRIVEAEPGRAVLTATPGEQHCNPFGTVHGGYTSTLLDTALGLAIQTGLPKGRTSTTVELAVKLVRAITPATGPLRVEARLVHVGSRIGTAEARVVDAAGKLYAHGSTTCLVLEAETGKGKGKRA